jgi:hypothetical protein
MCIKGGNYIASHFKKSRAMFNFTLMNKIFCQDMCAFVYNVMFSYSTRPITILHLLIVCYDMHISSGGGRGRFGGRGGSGVGSFRNEGPRGGRGGGSYGGSGNRGGYGRSGDFRGGNRGPRGGSDYQKVDNSTGGPRGACSSAPSATAAN